MNTNEPEISFDPKIQGDDDDDKDNKDNTLAESSMDDEMERVSAVLHPGHNHTPSSLWVGFHVSRVTAPLEKGIAAIIASNSLWRSVVAMRVYTWQ